MEPPRRRGKVLGVELHAPANGITPAQAGKRHSMHQRKASAKDHPRIGGEKMHSERMPPEMTGSPPHGRGKEHRQGREGRSRRITPAWAGKRLPLPDIAAQTQDHPRIGGEKHAAPASLMWSAGSPPHGRGKGTAGLSHRQGVGITPAWAGKSPASQPWSPPLWMMVIRPRP